MSPIQFLRTLTKSKSDAWLGGVCGGLGVHTPLHSWAWRILFLVLFFCVGTGGIACLVLWICRPDEQPGKPEALP